MMSSMLVSIGEKYHPNMTPINYQKQVYDDVSKRYPRIAQSRYDKARSYYKPRAQSGRSRASCGRSIACLTCANSLSLSAPKVPFRIKALEA
jgi:hypothetical protein